MSLLLAFTRFIRLPNLLIVIATQAIIYLFYIRHFATRFSVSSIIDPGEMWIFMLIVTLIALGGYVINDIKDIDIDEINHQDRMFVTRHISLDSAMKLYWILTLVTIGFALYWTIVTGLWFILPVLIGSIILLYFYSTFFKRRILIGNVIVALFCALVPLMIMLIESETIMGIAFEHTPSALWIGGIIGAYSFFAFASTLYREIVKDIEDYPGDKASGCTTMPILFGVAAAKNFATSIGLLLLLCLGGWLVYQWSFQNLVNQLFVLLGLILPLFISLLRLFRARNVADFRKVSQAIKLLMVNGLIYLFVLRMLIPS